MPHLQVPKTPERKSPIWQAFLIILGLAGHGNSARLQSVLRERAEMAANTHKDVLSIEAQTRRMAAAVLGGNPDNKV